MNHAAIGWDSDYGFSRYDAECAAADRFSALVDDMMSEPAFIESWFADYDIEDSDQACELVRALSSNYCNVTRTKVASQFIEDLSTGMCNNINDFFAYYGCDQKTAAELWLVITENGTPLAWADLRTFCEEELRTRE